MLIKLSKLVVFGCLLAVLLLAAYNHGQEREGTTNFWTVFAIIAVNFAALTIGGFFAPII